MLRSKAIGGPPEEERTAMKRFDRVAAGVVFALAAALGPQGADARDVTIELMNAQGKPIGHASIAPESGGVRLRVDVTGLAPGSHGIHFHDVGKCGAPLSAQPGGHSNTVGNHNR